jgi:hypothetical protein
MKIVARQGLARWGWMKEKAWGLLRRQPLCPLSYGRAIVPDVLSKIWVSVIDVKPSSEVGGAPTPLTVP